jgi:Rab-like protein 2
MARDVSSLRSADLWDTAGQERFSSMHASYYFRADACIMVFDVTRKVTYKNLERWYNELQLHQPSVPTFVVANKV